MRDRKVITWTSVMTGNQQLPDAIKKVTIEYKTGDILGERQEEAAAAIPGIIINLPLANIEAVLGKLLQMDHLMTDQQLIAFIEQYKANYRQLKQSTAVPNLDREH